MVWLEVARLRKFVSCLVKIRIGVSYYYYRYYEVNAHHLFFPSLVLGEIQSTCASRRGLFRRLGRSQRLGFPTDTFTGPRESYNFMDTPIPR